MIELLIQSYWIALLTVWIIGGLIGSFFLRRFKKNNPIPSQMEWIQKEQTKYWNKK